MTECNINIDFTKKKIRSAYIKYNKELKQMSPCPKKARMAIFIKKTLTYKRLPQYENDLNSFIWIKLQLKNSKPFFFGGGYRQWSLPSEMGLKDTKSAKNQIFFVIEIMVVGLEIKSGHNCCNGQ